MTVAAAIAELPAGLPIGDGWVPAPATAAVRFPYDQTLVGHAPVGSPAG